MITHRRERSVTMNFVRVEDKDGAIRLVNFDLVKMIEFKNHNIRDAEPTEPQDEVWLWLHFVEGYAATGSIQATYSIPIHPTEKSKLESIFMAK